MYEDINGLSKIEDLASWLIVQPKWGLTVLAPLAAAMVE
jgi:hypothetical protein